MCEPDRPQQSYRTRPGETALATRTLTSVGGRHPTVPLSHPEEAPRADPYAGCSMGAGREKPPATRLGVTFALGYLGTGLLHGTLVQLDYVLLKAGIFFSSFIDSLGELCDVV